MQIYIWSVICVLPSKVEGIPSTTHTKGMFFDGRKAETYCREMNEFVKGRSTGEFFYCHGMEAMDTPPTFTHKQILRAMWETDDFMETNFECEDIGGGRTYKHKLLEELGIKED